MSRKMRIICATCDKELAPRNAAPGSPDMLYVDERHRGCKALSEGPPSRSFQAVLPPGKCGVTGFVEVGKPKVRPRKTPLPEVVEKPKAPLFICKVKP